MLKKMVIPGERIVEEEESENTDVTDSVESDIASILVNHLHLVELHLVC